MRNPANLVELPRQSHKEMLCLSPEEAERFLNAADEDRFGVLNENPKVVSERLKQANISLTLDTYSHVLPSMQQAASEKLENLAFAKVAHKMKVTKSCVPVNSLLQ